MEKTQNHVVFISSLYEDGNHDNSSCNCDLSPLTYKIAYNHLASEEGNEEGTLLHNYSHESTRKIHQFYFIKLHSFVDPALKANIEMAMKLREKLRQAKESILTNTTSLKRDQILYREKCRYDCLKTRRLSGEEYLRSCIEYYGLQGSRISMSNADQIPNYTNINEKIQKLKNGVMHGARNVAEERRHLREIKELQRMKELMNYAHQDSTLHRRSSLPYSYYFAKSDPLPTTNNKREIQRFLYSLEEKVQILSAREREAKKRYECKLAEFDKERMDKNKNLCEINKKNAFIKERIEVVRKELDEQTACYDEYIKCLTIAKELAAKNDLITLEQLSNKHVEEFMNWWNNNDDFRAKYTRSVIESLDNRNLSNDGRRRNPGEKLTAYDVPGKQKFTWHIKINPC